MKMSEKQREEVERIVKDTVDSLVKKMEEEEKKREGYRQESKDYMDFLVEQSEDFRQEQELREKEKGKLLSAFNEGVGNGDLDKVKEVLSRMRGGTDYVF